MGKIMPTAPIPSAPFADAADLAEVQTLPQLFERRVRETPSGEAYRTFDAAAGDWRSLTWRDFGREVRRRRLALMAERFAKGDRVAILLPSGIEHVALDQAVLAQGLVPVPMHALDNSESIAYILKGLGRGRPDRRFPRALASDRGGGRHRCVAEAGGHDRRPARRRGGPAPWSPSTRG